MYRIKDIKENRDLPNVCFTICIQINKHMSTYSATRISHVSEHDRNKRISLFPCLYNKYLFVPRWTQKGDNTTPNIDIIVVYCAIRKHTIDQLHLISECKTNYIYINFVKCETHYASLINGNTSHN